MLTVGVVGSRKLITGDHRVKQIVADFLFRYGATRVVSGGAIGVDKTGAGVARTMGLVVEEFLPDWEQYGNSAGFQRNGRIADEADHLLAIMIPGGSNGTKDTIRKAMRLGKPVTVYTVPLDPPQPDDQ